MSKEMIASYLSRILKKTISGLRIFWTDFLPLLTQIINYFLIWGILHLLLEMPNYFRFNLPSICIGKMQIPMEELISQFLDIWIVTGIFAILIVYILKVFIKFWIKK